MSFLTRPSSQNIIHARNGEELVRDLRRRGHDERKVYFKYYGKFPDASLLPHTHLRPDLNLAIEFTLLSALHKAAPNGIVRPLAMVKKSPLSLSAVGYVMEYIEGSHPRFDGIEIFAKTGDVKQFFSTLEQLHHNGLGHGDALGNIIVTPNGAVKLIDPLAYFDFNQRVTMKRAIEADRGNMRTIQIWRAKSGLCPKV